MNPEREEIYKTAHEKWGVGAQMDMAVEEMAELIQAINKIKRTFHPAQLALFRLGETKFETEREALIYAGICGEIADVKIMIEQLEMIFNGDQINLTFDRKIERLKSRLNK